MNITPFNARALFRTETFSDGAAGEIVAIIPCTVEGDPDPIRTVRFRGRCSATFGNQQLNLEFDLPGTTLTEAVGGWEKAVKSAIEDVRSQAARQRILAPANH